MTTPANIIIQQLNVPIGTFVDKDGKTVLVYATQEWRRPLEQMAKLVNQLQARITALGG